MTTVEKREEVQKALINLGYAYGFVSRFKLDPIDGDRVRVICDGMAIGIYDFEKHTFVD